VIAEYLRLRAHHLRPGHPADRARPRAADGVAHPHRSRADRVAATNQLTALLEALWPGAAAVFADVASPISLAFLTRYPTPAHAATLGEKRMDAF
jgi:hypothetical protein